MSVYQSSSLKGLVMARVPRFRTRMAEYLKKHNLSRMDIVRSAGLSYPTVLKWERDELKSIDTAKLQPVLDLFGVTYEQFVEVVTDEGDK